MTSLSYSQQTASPASDLYSERFRPRFHYSPPCKWMNDPNGLVYFEGEYHLFYQYHPGGMAWGPMHWGHAVSTDLVTWQTLPVALHPDDLGTIFSGSVVVDRANTSGLVPGGGLVAIYSYHTQTQGIASSTDRGRTWTKYAGNPVLPAMAKDFRDPKVFWHEATDRWVMALAVGNQVQLFTSRDLIAWNYASTFMVDLPLLGVWEMPDLFPLAFHGQTKWVMLISVGNGAPARGSGTMVFLGDFDGERFIPDSLTPHWLDYGPDNYAGTTWSNAPGQETLFIGWMSNWLYADQTPTSPWRGVMTIPRTLALAETSHGVRITQRPIAGLASLRTPLAAWDDIALTGTKALNVEGRVLEVVVEFEPVTASRFGLELQRGPEEVLRISYDMARQELAVARPRPAGLSPDFAEMFAASLTCDAGRLRLHILLDEMSLEVFANDGAVTLTSQQFIDPANKGVALFAEGGEVRVSCLKIYALASIWSDHTTPVRVRELCE